MSPFRHSACYPENFKDDFEALWSIDDFIKIKTGRILSFARIFKMKNGTIRPVSSFDLPGRLSRRVLSPPGRTK
jgi:hypothetical protein